MSAEGNPFETPKAANDNLDPQAQESVHEFDKVTLEIGKGLFRETVEEFIAEGFPAVTITKVAELLLNGQPNPDKNLNSLESHLYDNLRSLLLEYQKKEQNNLSIKSVEEVIRALKVEFQKHNANVVPIHPAQQTDWHDVDLHDD